MFKEAAHYKKLKDKQVQCQLCPHNCIIENGEVGKCKVRMNITGKLKSLNYGKLHTIKEANLEQIPLYHFHPSSKTLIVKSPGNSLFSKFHPREFPDKEPEQIPSLNQKPSQLIKHSDKLKINSITYSDEPTLFYEFVKDTSQKSKLNILETNGFIEQKPLMEVTDKLNAASINILSMQDSFYEQHNTTLEHSLKTAKTLFDKNIWCEVKLTIPPKMNEDFYEIRKLISWILHNMDYNTPLHFITFKPKESTNNYPQTSPEVLIKARKIAMQAGLNFVYTHGTSFPEGQNTYCPNCKKPVIIRTQDSVENLLQDGKCSCGKQIAGIWQ